MGNILRAFASVSRKNANLRQVKKSLEYIKTHAVYVGIPQKTTTRPPTEDRKGDPVTNAELLFIHTNGSPINNIPPRPVIEPAIENDKERLNRMFKKVTDLVLKGEYEQADAMLEEIGMRGQNISRNWFTNPDNGWAPNSPLTIALKGSDRPLIDTGELRKSITYVVDKGEGV